MMRTLFKPTILNDGLAASHDMPCAVVRGEPAVIDCADNVFHPSWIAQSRGWRLVRVTNLAQRIALRALWPVK